MECLCITSVALVRSLKLVYTHLLKPCINLIGKCAAVDDALMKITHVIRAEEHLSNTIQQLLVYDALGVCTSHVHFEMFDFHSRRSILLLFFAAPGLKPPKFAHVSLILGEDKQKLRYQIFVVTKY